jgi:hypothetical protein
MADRDSDMRICSSGACWEQAAYECGIQIVGMPKMSVNTSLQIEPPIWGTIAGFTLEERWSEAAAKRTQG